MKVSEEYVQRLLGGADTSNSIAQLVQFWTPRASRCQHEARLGLSAPEFAVHMIVMYDGEVGNGGHSQFFLNASGGYTNAVLEALDTLELFDVRRILWKAASAFPGGLVPEDAKKRCHVVQAAPPSVLELWGRLDREYHAVAGAIDGHLLQFLRAHQNEVLVEERAP